MIRKITFPPILLFIAILMLGAIVNIMATISMTSQGNSELYMLQISTSLDKDRLSSPGRLSITITVEGVQNSSYSAVYVYDPDSRLYAVKEGTLSNGFAIFDIYFGWSVKQGNYTIIPAVGLSKHQVVFGNPVFIEVAYGGV
ncbi:MAG: hypothetical protein NZ879_05735 [Archaeoglobaceae archaeon]|nr:hypothetical protein [Archaeoglobaceae archaeon]MDW8118468.1 hypothetical protein [Archaeoglobaceae archaeon]